MNRNHAVVRRRDHHGYGSFLVRPVFLRIYFAIFNWFRGALDHLLTRIQLARRSIADRLSRDLRRSGCLKNSRLMENRRLLSLPVRLSMNERWFVGIANTSRYRFPPDGCSGLSNAGSIHVSLIIIIMNGRIRKRNHRFLKSSDMICIWNPPPDNAI